MQKKNESATKRSTVAKKKLQQSIKSVDMFGETITFEIDGHATKKSFLGSFISAAIIVITFSYAFTRFEVMRGYADTRYQQTTVALKYTKDEPLSHDESKFDLAIGI